MQTVAVTQSEYQSGTIDAEHLQAAISAIRQDGFVGLLNVTEVAHVDAIHQQMVRDIAAWNASPEGIEAPVRGGNFTPSRRAEFVFRDILMNPIVAAVLIELLGRELTCGMYSSNVTMPGLGEQELHVDAKPNAVGDDMSLPCSSVVVNFPLVDFTEENGATELWPGTQHVMREPGETYVSQRLQDAQRAVMPPERAILPRGAALIRDVRLWHRGRLNSCDTVRPMIAMMLRGNFRLDSEGIERITSVGVFPRATAPLFQDDPVILYNPEWTDDEIESLPSHQPRKKKSIRPSFGGHPE